MSEDFAVVNRHLGTAIRSFINNMYADLKFAMCRGKYFNLLRENIN